MSTTRKRHSATRQTEPLPVRSTRSSRARTEKKEPTVSRNGGLTTASPTLLAEDEIAAAKELLRQFDMSFKYGPCVGISRTIRWERAHKFGLEPPQKIKEMLSDVITSGHPRPRHEFMAW